MKQQVMVKPGEIIFRDVPAPEISDNQALVRIARIGVCGSDIHVYHGKHPFTKYPVTQGHEVSGVIERAGAATGLRVGQKVTIEPQIVCGKCYPCRHGRYNLCQSLRVMGFQAPGTASEFFAVDAAKITPLPDTFSLDDGAMIEPLAVAVHAAEQAGDLAGKSVVVLGAGPIGNLVAQTCKGMGARRVLVTDVSDFRLALAAECGADETVNTAKADLAQAMLRVFGEDGADVIYDCAGNDTTINQAIHCARKGSDIVLVAVFDKLANVDLAVLNDSELTLKTSMMYRHEHYLKAIDMVRDGKVRLAPLQSRHFPFARYADAYQYIDEHRETTMKVLIDL